MRGWRSVEEREFRCRGREGKGARMKDLRAGREFDRDTEFL